MVAQTQKHNIMNTVIYCDTTGMIEISTFNTAQQAIDDAKITIREYNKAYSVKLVGLRINFSDGTSAVYNNIQKSECLLNATPPIVFIPEQSDEEYFLEQIGDGTREDIEAFFYNEECGDR